jgi:uncharacterized protein YyaL (SSP411 family)
VLLPSADDAATWFVETARAAIDSGARVDADVVELLISLAPGDPVVVTAIESLSAEPSTLAGYARDAARRLRDAVAAGDQTTARDTVTALETEVLRVYRPSHGLGGFEDDAAVALTMLAAHGVGADDAHLMMAEELMLGLIRREWEHRARHGLRANCEAAVALAVLAARTGKEAYRERALEVMRDYAASYRDHGVAAAPYVSALRAVRA